MQRLEVVSFFEDILEQVYEIPASVATSNVSNAVAIGSVLHIPDSVAYEALPKVRVLELLAHEIETHLLTYHNHIYA